MTDSIPTTHDFLTYLDSIRDLYPGGIPAALIAEQTDPVVIWGNVEARVWFLASVGDLTAPFHGKRGALLRGAITKGMQLATDSTCVVAVMEEALQDQDAPCAQRAAEFILETVKSTRPEMVIVLGGELLAVLFPDASALERGKWRKYHGSMVLASHDLGDIIRSKECKKEFWLDLQAVMQRLAG